MGSILYDGKYIGDVEGMRLGSTEFKSVGSLVEVIAVGACEGRSLG